tara:strand:+ start:1390 stop:1656 length:267 start_codon:yes stop_codon:yes gene_type:complete
MKSIFLKSGDIVAISIRGSRGFYYPGFKSGPIKVDKSCIGYPMTWLKQSGFHAYSVPSESISSVASSDPKKPYVVVWVSEKLINKRFK